MNQEVASRLLITLDIDWAPDFVIDEVADIFIRNRVRSTWFVTHTSPAIDRLQQRPDIFELGIHPNFLEHSTHGETPGSVISHCKNLLPGARCFRTHGLVQSTLLLQQLMSFTEVEIDASLYLPHASHVEALSYWWKGRRLTRVPFIWEDDFEMERPAACWETKLLLQTPGLKVLNFHPMLLFLNDPTQASYIEAKRRCPTLNAAEAHMFSDLRKHHEGPFSMLSGAIDLLAGNDGGMSLSDLVRGAALEAS